MAFNKNFEYIECLKVNIRFFCAEWFLFGLLYDESQFQVLKFHLMNFFFLTYSQLQFVATFHIYF